MTTYSNPRRSAIIENWPHGSQRVTAQFSIEVDAKRGERAVRVTTGAPKKLTFARKMRIVDGDDGRTYIATLSGYGHVTIFKGDMKYHHESVFEREPRYAELLALFAEGRAMKIRQMSCCVCGDDAGRWQQHWNRDTGYGVCVKCIKWLRSRNTSETEILDLYGKEGANWGVQP